MKGFKVSELFVVIITACFTGAYAACYTYDCYYYSYTYYVSPATIGGSVAGSIFTLALLIGLCVCCCKRSQANAGTTIIAPPQQGISVVSNTQHVNQAYMAPGYPQPYAPQQPYSPQQPPAAYGAGFSGAPPPYVAGPYSTPAYNVPQSTQYKAEASAPPQ